MQSTREQKAIKTGDFRSERAPYEPPSIIYEGVITIRAGSPFAPDPFTGEPPAPFND